MCFVSIHSNFHFICIFTSAFSCSPLPPTWLLVVGRAKVDSLCAQNACFVKKVKNSNCVSSCFSKAMYNHAKTRKIYPSASTKHQLRVAVGSAPPVARPSVRQKYFKKKWRAFPLLFNANRKYVASAYPSAKHIFKNAFIFFAKQNLKKGERFLCFSILIESIRNSKNEQS